MIGFKSMLYVGLARQAVRCASTTVVPPKPPTFTIQNEPMLDYKPGSEERKKLEAALKKYTDAPTDVPCVVGGQEIRVGEPRNQVMPFDHQKTLATYYWATKDVINKAIATAEEVRPKWEAVPIEEKIKLFLKAADLMATKYRYDLNATTMLGQGKVVWQAEIDSAAENTDFLRFAAHFAREMLHYHPISTDPDVTVNLNRWRGLEGFVAAVTPFNFTAIGGNLSSAPTLMGNVVLWKPSDTAVLSNYTTFQVFQEAGFPPGVINFLPSNGPTFGDAITASPLLAGINFTGSVPTFQRLWKQVGNNIGLYKSFPRLIGECGGKNFHLIHPSADLTNAINQTLRSAFEYQGQKCSACSRLYVPQSLWPAFKEGLVERQKAIKVGSPLEFDSFMSAVIDHVAYKRITSYVTHAAKTLRIIAGGKFDDSVGYFVEPTIVETHDPREKIMREEIFGPVLTVYPFEDRDLPAVMNLIGSTTPFALTGAIFAQDKDWLKEAAEKLKFTAGNFYINDKCTGAVVGQQPFGGARLSGTNDKAGGPVYLYRWASPQSVKETFTPLTDWKYPSMHA